MPQYARQTAIPTTVAELVAGSWVQNEGLTPSGVQTADFFINRTSILGVIIEKNDASFTVEDGTGSITVRSFDLKPLPVAADVGDIVLVIGKPREYNAERYIVLEICRKIRNKAWIEYRRKELAIFRSTKTERVEQPVIEPIAERNPFEVIIGKIRELDAGAGVDIDEVIPVMPDAEKFVRTLLEEGEIFEIRPGRLKVLE